MRSNEPEPVPSSIKEAMRPEHRALLPLLTAEERASLEENVNPESMALIETWIGTREEIEQILFWDRGGKYDDPARGAFEPVDDTTDRLFRTAHERIQEWKREAVESQLRSDLTLYSQFNHGLLFTGLAGAVQCDRSGVADGHGGCFRGIDLRCVGSVEEETNRVRIEPREGGAFDIRFGSEPARGVPGMRVYTGDSFALLQLEKLISRDLARCEWRTELLEASGHRATLDPKTIRKAARKGLPPPHGKEMFLNASARVQGLNASLEKAAEGARLFYERFGLETECSKIGRRYGNFHIIRNDNFNDFLPDKGPSPHRGLVLFTATLVCRRCRREIPSFRNLAADFPHITFGLVNIASPQFMFYERVFADMGGGDAKQFRNNAEGSTPFTIVYAPNASGRLEFKEYHGTDKAEAPPSETDIRRMLKRYF